MTHFTLSTIIFNHRNSINTTQNNRKSFHSKEFLSTQSTQHKTPDKLSQQRIPHWPLTQPPDWE